MPQILTYDQLLPCDLLLVRGKGWVGREIEAITHSTYSHVAGVVAPRDRNGLIEAQGMRLTGFQDASAYAGVADVYRCDKLDAEKMQTILDSVFEELGTHYDYPMILWELVRYTLHLTMPMYEFRHRRICSTLWGLPFREAGIDVCPWIKYPSPGDLALDTENLRLIGSI